MIRLASILSLLFSCATILPSVGQTHQTSEVVKLWERGLLSSKIANLQVLFISENANDSISFANMTGCMQSVSSDFKIDLTWQSPTKKTEVCLNLKNTFPLDSLKSIVNQCGGSILYLRVSVIKEVE